MKTIINIFMLLLFVSTIYSQDCESEIFVKTNTPNSFIYVDNDFAGNGNVELKLKSGIHFIKIKDVERKWDAKIIQDTIHIHDCGEEISLSYKLPERYYLDSEPQDAFVYKSDLLIGNTPLFIHNGIDKVLLTKDDYAEKFIKLKDINRYKKVNLDFTGEINGSKFTETPWFEILIGTAVAFGATAAHFKIQADKKYDKYLETQNPAYLNETDNLDLYSGIAFGALQVNFGLLIYFLLSE
ncbi:hypothetical protein ACFLR4_01960 [Bacteroidota bacterium]